MSSCVRPFQSGRDGPFFCCELIGPCYKPPPADGVACKAGVAELVDALDLGSSDESCGGSSPSARTKRSRVCIWDFRGARRLPREVEDMSAPFSADQSGRR